MSPEVAAAIWSGGFTVLGIIVTLITTSIINSKAQKNQYEFQERTFNEERKHQKELAIIQHAMDKRTEIVLEFRRTSTFTLVKSIYYTLHPFALAASNNLYK
ncbi:MULTISPECIES: hypothetical protein [Priestia]|jgi:hypothetical protein|uniref:hypothetical protein n=1 Tax=Priestia TaxID=2800373 RepID=UPI00203F590B|nr:MULTISPECIES: hypothetical protein [Priestia]MCM3771235.1 hypothetical protein [Priestia aryabhattai]MDY0941821.1 hypothetical protein [Priestia megaterium]